MLFTIAAEIPVTATPAEYLRSSVASLSEGATLTINRETISGFYKSVIVVRCNGALMICFHFIFCLRINTYKSSDQIVL